MYSRKNLECSDVTHRHTKPNMDYPTLIHTEENRYLQTEFRSCHDHEQDNTSTSDHTPGYSPHFIPRSFLPRSNMFHFMSVLVLGIWVTLFSCGPMTLVDGSPPQPIVRPPGSRGTELKVDMCIQLDIHCVHGTCLNGTRPRCVCDPGWKGPACDTCGGRVKLTAGQGYISDGALNYTTDTKCTWLLEAPSADHIIRLRFLHFATECSWDHLYIFDGSSVFSPQIAAYSGLVIPNGSRTDVMPEVTMTGSAYLHFYSDAAYNMSGFNISYVMGASCPLNCSGNGECDLTSGECRCHEDWHGEGCNVPRCPNDCSAPNGTCQDNGSGKECECSSGKGPDCSIAEDDGFWETLHPTFPPSPRSSHKHVKIGSFIYVFHGYWFNNVQTDSVVRLNLDSSQWEAVPQKGKELPGQRYGHSVAYYKKLDKVFMFGGLLTETNNITTELWDYNVSNSQWSKWKINAGVLEVVGHTAHIIHDTMYIIFGHNPNYGYLNTVQEFNLTTSRWSIPQTSGATVNGGYGHSSVVATFDDMPVIYVHAGYVSTTPITYALTADLYMYSINKRSWTVLRASEQPKFLHSAVMLNGMMYVFGGNTHNDTNISQGAKCYSSTFLAYNPVCGTWWYMPPPLLHEDISRFGHIAEVHEGRMYIIGGFNGQVLSDVQVYTPAVCNQFGDSTSCLYNQAGVQCVWADGKQCLTPADAQHKLNFKNIQTIEEKVCTPISEEETKHGCEALDLCPTCVSSFYGCSWCDSACQPTSDIPDRCKPKKADTYDQCLANYSSDSTQCPAIHNCESCKNNPLCTWNSQATKCEDSFSGNSQANEDTSCSVPCHMYKSCDNCTTASCMWCGNERRCVESISYVASFPYGQCMEWTTYRDRCPATSCEGLRTCSDCQNSPACGWCDDGSNTGLGQCMEGGLTGPAPNTTLSTGTCSNTRWYFQTCPACQCNGHSQCGNNTDRCVLCEDNTTGENCEMCADGYFGTSTNGGNCSMCECNGQADTCHHETGKCFCHTRGVKGDKCDVCDEQNKYYGDPKNGGTCFYALNTNYKFTFNLSEGKDENKYHTHINFMNEPPDPDRDVDFNINCSGHAYMNITIKTSEEVEEQIIYTHKPCQLFEEEFSHKIYPFGGNSNTTFFVYVYDFETPFIVEISFLQIDPIDLIHFFITFFSCFLSLLLIAAVVWKVKQKCDMHRRRQRMVVQMEQMASRPFASTNIYLPSTIEEALLVRDEVYAKQTNTIRGSGRFKRSPGSRYSPSPIALEPIAGNKAGVLTLLIRLPTGDEEFTPEGHHGLAVGSTIVTIGNHRKNSSAEPPRVDKNSKLRKTAESPENCV